MSSIFSEIEGNYQGYSHHIHLHDNTSVTSWNTVHMKHVLNENNQPHIVGFGLSTFKSQELPFLIYSVEINGEVLLVKEMMYQQIVRKVMYKIVSVYEKKFNSCELNEITQSDDEDAEKHGKKHIILQSTDGKYICYLYTFCEES
jgi:hypothetical protein